jgi:DNA (cytosine-5)-methyltransferase 1
VKHDLVLRYSRLRLSEQGAVADKLGLSHPSDVHLSSLDRIKAHLLRAKEKGVLDRVCGRNREDHLMKQLRMNLSDELIVDLFAGGGGASLGIEMATGRMVDIAVNHDLEAVAMHMANHPTTKHYISDVFEVDPLSVTDGRPVGLLWASPDCKHFSKAKGGKPVSKKIRSLAWVVVKWAKLVRPRVICMENVEEFQTWGPLTEDGRPCPVQKGRTFRTWMGRLEHLGYRVEYRELKACNYGAPTTRNRLFLVARCDGLPIIWPTPTHYDPADKRYRGHKGKVYNADGIVMRPWRTAAECIDWSIPCPSIFLTKEQGKAVGAKRPLADATLRRIAKGIMRYVVNSANPFIVPVTHQGGDRTHDLHQPLRTVTGAHRGELALVAPVLTEHANASSPRCNSVAEPLRTICAEVKGGHHALIAPTLVVNTTGHAGGTPAEPLHTITTGGHHALVAAHIQRDFGRSVGHSAHDPLATVTAGAGGHAALVSAFLAKHYTGATGSDLAEPAGAITSVDHHSLVAANLIHMGHGEQSADGAKRWSHGVRDIETPFNTVTASGTPAGLAVSHLCKLRGTSTAQGATEPLHTVSAQGLHFAEVRAFLIKYYGVGQDVALDEPLHTVTSRDRFGLVTIRGEQYAIVDIGLRMLAPRELYRAQGFPDDYIIEIGAGGEPLTKTAQVRMCGNSVCPPVAAAIVRANYRDIELERVA